MEGQAKHSSGRLGQAGNPLRSVGRGVGSGVASPETLWRGGKLRLESKAVALGSQALVLVCATPAGSRVPLSDSLGPCPCPQSTYL